MVGTRKNRPDEAGRGGSNEYPQSMFLSKNMKNNVLVNAVLTSTQKMIYIFEQTCEKLCIPL